MIETSLRVLSQLSEVASRLTKAQYTAKLDLLHGNSIGKHMRHIAEFFDILTHNGVAGQLCYDDRKRELALERDPAFLTMRLRNISDIVPKLNPDQSIRLQQNYSTTGNGHVMMQSSLARELSYNIEHAIHHMAIIKIAIVTVFPDVPLDPAFGIAYSTLRFEKEHKAG